MRTATKLLLILTILFTACQKEIDYATGNTADNTGGTGGTGNNNNNSTSNIEGDYDFVGMAAHTEAAITVDASGSEVKSVTVSDYETKNNRGTMKITADQFISTDFFYTAETVANVKTYMDNVLMAESDVPIVASTPPSTCTTPYAVIAPTPSPLKDL